jgi:DUF4097 and DUF4098 domain-containing protein YvlB
MTNARKYPRISIALLAVFPLLTMVAAAQQSKKEVSYTVGPKANISITNRYGSITVKPSGTRQVLVTATSNSEDVSFVNEQRGNRIELRVESSRAGSGIADYTVLVPTDAFVTLRSSDGILHAQGLRGDVTLESVSASIEATDLSGAYVSVKTLNGSVLLSDIRNSHLYVRSIRGNVSLRNVTGSAAEVHSGTGRILYEGDPGRMGEYSLTSHAGDLEIAIPVNASVAINAHSDKGKTDPSLAESLASPPRAQGNLLLKRGANSTSSFVLRSFKGNIHVKRTP